MIFEKPALIEAVLLEDHLNSLYWSIANALLRQMSQNGRVIRTIELSFENWQRLAYQVPSNTFLPPEQEGERVALVIAIHGRKLRIFASPVMADTHLRVIE